MKRPISLAVVGATGLVGRTMLRVVEEREIPVRHLSALASSDSKDKRLEFGKRSLEVKSLENKLPAVDYALFAVKSPIAAEWAPRFRDAGAVVIDNSSHFRMKHDVPLVVPEANRHTLLNHQGIIANPNCTAAIVSVALAPLHRAFGLSRIIISTYQSVSGSGQRAIEELEKETADSTFQPKVYPHPIAFNLFPQIGDFNSEGLCVEEEKIAEELRKIFETPELFVAVTTVRVPVRVGHSISIFAEFQEEVTLSETCKQLRSAPGLILMENQNYATPQMCAGRDEVFAGRLRVYSDNPRALSLWVCGDNLRKGAALNAVQILECLMMD